MGAFRVIATAMLCGALCAQQAVLQREIARGAPAGGSGEEASLTVLLVYPAGAYSEADVHRWERGLDEFSRVEQAGRGSWRTWPVTELIESMLNGGTNLARARKAGPPAAVPSQRTGHLGELFTGQTAVAGVMLKQSGGDTPCPPSPCGCDTPGAISSCGCTLLRDSKMGDFCMCYLCYQPVILSDSPTPRMAGGRVFLVLVAPEGRSLAQLVARAQREAAQARSVAPGYRVLVRPVDSQ